MIEDKAINITTNDEMKLKNIVDMIADFDKKIKTGEMKENIAIKTIVFNILKARGNNDR